MSRARNVWPAVVRRLDRPGRRALLVVPGSIWVSWTYREPCVVYWRDGAWIHHYRRARIPHAVLGRAAPPDVFVKEAREVFLWAYTPQQGDIVFDVGAGIGTEALLLSRLVGPTGRVVSVEAHPRTYARLVALCDASRLGNVTPLQVAVAEHDGEVSLSDLDVHLQNQVVDEGPIRVAARRVDTIAAELGIDHIDFLKMNIEGAERGAVQSLGALLSTVQNVCISCHDFLADAGGPDELRTKAGIQRFLVDHGFEVTTRDDAAEPWIRDYVYGSKRPAARAIRK